MGKNWNWIPMLRIYAQKYEYVNITQSFTYLLINVHTTQSRTGVENQQNLERIDILCEGPKVLGNYELNVRKLFGIHSLTLPGVSIFWISKRCCFNLF